MLTLLAITVPVEIIFLSVLHWFGWLETPFMFVALSVLFFCCAVRVCSSLQPDRSFHLYFLH